MPPVELGKGGRRAFSGGVCLFSRSYFSVGLGDGPSLFQTLFLPSLFNFFLLCLSGPASAREVRTGPIFHFFFFLEKGKKKTLTLFLLLLFRKNFKKQKNKTRKTVVAALDMPLPEDYIRRLAPPPRSDAAVRCAVTGEPAKYRDPVTGAPYATVEAFKALRAAAAGAAAGAAGAPKATNVAAGEFFSVYFFLFSTKTKQRGPCVRKRRAFFYS